MILIQLNPELNLNNYVTLKDCLAEESNGYLISTMKDNMIGFKYNEKCIFNMHWNKTTLNARGVVFDRETGEVLARPFHKFFNYEEISSKNGLIDILQDEVPDCTKKFRAMEKIDGSLGIIFYHEGWIVKTGGSFYSDQAIWAQKWFNEHVNTEKMNKKSTYCAEILYKEDKHPVKYDYEGLVLLGILDTKTGLESGQKEIEDIAKSMNIHFAKSINFNDFFELYQYAKTLPISSEGVVVTFEDGKKLKIKGEEFLKLQKIFHNLNPKIVWNSFDYNKNDYKAGFIESIPEEMQDLIEISKELKKKYFAILKGIKAFTKTIDISKVHRKTIWTIAGLTYESKILRGAVMNNLYNGNCNFDIWKYIANTL